MIAWIRLLPSASHLVGPQDSVDDAWLHEAPGIGKGHLKVISPATGANKLEQLPARRLLLYACDTDMSVGLSLIQTPLKGLYVCTNLPELTLWTTAGHVNATVCWYCCPGELG
jgi:hypothetical protein